MGTLLVSMPLGLRFRLKTSLRRRKFLLFTAAALMEDVIGLALVFLVSHHGVAAVRSNLCVSVCMTPVGLCLNSWVLTGRWRPSIGQALSWYTYWLPTSTRNTYYAMWLVATFSTSGVRTRLIVGLTFFLLDYATKRWVIFGKYGELARFYYTKASLWAFHGDVIKIEMA